MEGWYWGMQLVDGWYWGDAVSGGAVGATITYTTDYLTGNVGT